MDVTVTAANSLDGKNALYRGGPAQTLAITIAPAGDAVTLLEASRLSVVFPAASAPTALTASGSQAAWSAPVDQGAGVWSLVAVDGADWERTAPLVLTVSGLDIGGIATPTLDVTIRATLRSAFDQKTVALTVPVVDYADKDLKDLDVTFAVVGRQGVELASGQPAKLTVSITNGAATTAAAPAKSGAKATLVLQALVDDDEGVGGVLGAWSNVGKAEAAVRAQPAGGDWGGAGQTPTLTDGRAAWTFTPPADFLPANGAVQIGLDNLVLDAKLPPDLPDTTPLIFSWSNIPGRRDGVAVLILDRREAVPFVRFRGVDPAEIDGGGSARLSWESYAVDGLRLEDGDSVLGTFRGADAVSTTGHSVTPRWDGQSSQPVVYRLTALDSGGAPLESDDAGARLSDQVTLVVRAPMPVIRRPLSAAPNPYPEGDSVTLTFGIDPIESFAQLDRVQADGSQAPGPVQAESLRNRTSYTLVPPQTGRWRVMAARDEAALGAGVSAGLQTSTADCAVSIVAVQSLREYLLGRAFESQFTSDGSEEALRASQRLEFQPGGAARLSFGVRDSSGRDNIHGDYTVGWALDRDTLTITSRADASASTTWRWNGGGWAVDGGSRVSGRWAAAPALTNVFGVAPFGGWWGEGKLGADYLPGRVFSLWDAFNYLANFSGVDVGSWDSGIAANLQETLVFKAGGSVSHSLSVRDNPSLVDGGTYGQGFSPGVIGSWPAADSAAGTWSLDPADPANVVVVLEAGHSLKLRIFPTGLAAVDAGQLVQLKRRIGFGTRYPATDQVFPRKTAFFQG